MKKRAKLILKITAVILLFLMAIESFMVGIPYSITAGIMLISIGILFVPYLEKIIYIPLKGKIFIIITNFLTAAYSVKMNDTNYFKCVISAIIMLLFWGITILYYKYKNAKKVIEKK